MITINQENIGLIKLYKDAVLNNISAVYYKGDLVWSINNGSKSCFGGGFWVDTLPWIDDVSWKDV